MAPRRARPLAAAPDERTDRRLNGMSDAGLDPDTRVPASGSEWAEWLDEEKGKTLQVYRDKPQLLIADFRREQAISRDYEGREILELLQNANDAAAGMGESGRGFWPGVA